MCYSTRLPHGSTLELRPFFCSSITDHSFTVISYGSNSVIDRIPLMERGIPILLLEFPLAPATGPPGAPADASDAGHSVRLAITVYVAVRGILPLMS